MLLEVFNSLALSFVLSEFLLRSQRHSKHAHYNHTAWAVGGVVAVNVVALVLPHTPVRWLASVPREWAAYAASHFRTAFLLGAVAGVVVGGGAHARRARGKWQWARGTWGAVLVCTALVGAFWLAFELVGVDAFVRHSEATRVALAMLGFTALCFVDVRRRRPDLELTEFLVEVALHTLTLPAVFFVLAIAIAAVFLVVVAVCEALGIDPHLFNACIYYCVIYGPFSWVYFRVKRSLTRSALLLPA